MQWETYSSFHQTVSELSAIDAPTRSIWIGWGILYAVLVGLFGWGVRVIDEKNRALRATGGLILVYAIICLTWPLFPMHLREALAAGGGTWSDTMHIVYTILAVLVMISAMGFGAVALRKPFRIYTAVSMIILVFFGSLTSSLADDLDAGLPTPWMGLWERINIGVFLLWVVMLSAILMKVPGPTDRIGNSAIRA
jgi:hypothetical protein